MECMVTISYFSECSEFHSFMSPLYTVRAEISELSTKGEQCCMSKNDLPSYFILRVYCLTKTVFVLYSFNLVNFIKKVNSCMMMCWVDRCGNKYQW